MRRFIPPPAPSVTTFAVGASRVVSGFLVPREASGS